MKTAIAIPASPSAVFLWFSALYTAAFTFAIAGVLYLLVSHYAQR